MKRSPLVLFVARVVLLAALVVPFAAAAAPPAKQASKPAAKPAPAPAATGIDAINQHPKFRGWVDSVPDTGQFLPDSVWLVRVGPRVSTAGDFIDSWFASNAEYRPMPDSAGRVQFLQSIIQKEVLGLTALAINRPLEFEDRHKLREARQRALAIATFQRLVRDSITVEESEVRALYDTYRWDLRARHILVADRNAAELVRRELVSGRIAWSAAVKKYSTARSAAADGDLGWLRRETMETSIGNEVFALKPGETSQPLQDAQGWHIVQAVERRPKDPPAYEAFSTKLRGEVEGAKTTKYVERILTTLRIQEEVRYDTANVKFAITQFRTTVKTEAGVPGVGTNIEVDAAVPEFSDADTARLLVRWRNGGRYSLGELVETYSHISPLLRPSLTHMEAMIGFLETLILEPKIAEYGAQRGLEKDPLVVRTMEQRREELLVEHLYQDSVARFVWVSKEERQAYYQANLRSFFTYPSVQFAAIVRTSKASADSLQRALRAGASARAILAADSASGHVTGAIQSRRHNENGPYQKQLFEELRPGQVEVYGPDKQGDFVVVQLLHYDGGRQLSYAESEGMIDESVQNMKAEQALAAFVARHRPKYDVAWRPEKVMLVRLVDPSVGRGSRR